MSVCVLCESCKKCSSLRYCLAAVGECVPYDPDRDRLLFLDVDGVLNRSFGSESEIESSKVGLLKRVVDTCNPLVILSSSWRMFPTRMKRIRAILSGIKVRFGGVTPVIFESRGREIERWLDTHGTPARFVILDDDSNMEPLEEYQVQTKSHVGLAEKEVEEVIRRLRG